MPEFPACCPVEFRPETVTSTLPQFPACGFPVDFRFANPHDPMTQFLRISAGNLAVCVSFILSFSPETLIHIF